MNETLTPAYISEIARTIFQQLKSTTTFSVRGSWAAQNYQASVYKGMPALTFRVSGLRHKGRVYIAYNEGSDTYDIFLLNMRNRETKHIADVYCDNFGHIIDREVERGDSTEDVYLRKALADSRRKMGIETDSSI